jgi:chaperonin GroEL (HSP60 family)
LLQDYLSKEENMIKDMVEAVKKSGATVLFCQKGIDDLAQHYLGKAGIYAVRRVKKSDMDKLAKATGAIVVANLYELSPKDLGFAGNVEEQKIGDDKMTFITDCKNPKAVSVPGLICRCMPSLANCVLLGSMTTSFNSPLCTRSRIMSAQ